MNQDFEYIPYKSRRNHIIKKEETLNLLSKYCPKNIIEYLIKTRKKINLEIGFGSGEFILEQSIQNPKNIYLGCEVYNPGIIKLITLLKKRHIKNIFIYQGDARELLLDISDLFFNDIYILFPDPWPKKKHHKRRLINKNFLQFILKKFSSNLYISTDHDEYAESILYDILQSDDYKIKNLQIKKDKFFSTKFETKSILKFSNIFNFILNH